MITAIFVILMIAVFGKILKVALKASWALVKVVLGLGILPIALIVLAIVGLVKFALPILIIIGIVVLIKTLFSDDSKKAATEEVQSEENA